MLQSHMIRRRFTLSLEGSSHRAPSPYAICAHPRNPRLPSSSLFSYASAHHVHDRNALNSFCFKGLRTTFIATEGWGGSDEGFFKFYFNSLSIFCACVSLLAGLMLLSFHQLTTIKFSNHFVLITIRIARGRGTPLPVRDLKLYFNSARRTVRSARGSLFPRRAPAGPCESIFPVRCARFGWLRQAFRRESSPAPGYPFRFWRRC